VGGGDIYDVDEAAPCYSPSGDKIAFANWDGIWTMNADGSERRKIREAFHPIELTWSPQGNVIAFIASNDRTKMPDKGDAGYKLYLLSVDTGEVRRVFGPEEGVEYFCPAWNPKGNILAVERGYRHTPVLNGNTLEMTGPARYFIWIVLVNGVETFMPMQVTPDFPPPTVAGIPSNERDGPPTFSADGSKIVFPSTRKPPTGSPYFWWTINIDGSGLKSIEGPSVNTRNYDLVW
jgi:Tol biopolymer transport system component